MRTLLGTLAVFSAIAGCSDNGNDIGTERGGATAGSASSVDGKGSENAGYEPAGGSWAGASGILPTGGDAATGGSDPAGSAGAADPGTGETAGRSSAPSAWGEGGTGSGVPCEDQGEVYQHGETWACDCNTCRCEDGEITSTLIACDDGTGGLVDTGGSDAGGSGGSGTGGDEVGGTGGASTGGASIGGASTGGASTGGASTGGASGDACTSNLDCADDEYCYREVTQCTGTGVCELRARGCIAVVDLVCGCDGITYGNSCNAAEQGVSVRFAGTCEDAVHCGGNLGDTCAEDEYCAYQPPQQCGTVDDTSVCRERPTACTLEYAPVCGCDGRTYSNACAANAEGTGVWRTGEC